MDPSILKQFPDFPPAMIAAVPSRVAVCALPEESTVVVEPTASLKSQMAIALFGNAALEDDELALLADAELDVDAELDSDDEVEALEDSETVALDAEVVALEAVVDVAAEPLDDDDDEDVLEDDDDELPPTETLELELHPKIVVAAAQASQGVRR